MGENVIRAKINKFCSVQRATENGDCVPDKFHLVTDEDVKQVAESLKDTIGGIVFSCFKTDTDFPIEEVITKAFSDWKDAEHEVGHLI